MNPDTAIVPTNGEILPVQPIGIVRPITTAQDARDAWDEFTAIKQALLDREDYQHISGKDFLKRSGFLKLAAAFSVNTEIISAEKDDLTTPQGVAYFQWRLTVRATAPNGRYMEAVGACASNERNFAHKDADVFAQAQTRATSRAISNLIGGGTVSAEEVKAEPRPALTAEKATEMLHQFELSCEAQTVSWNWFDLAVVLMCNGGDLRRAFKTFKDSEPAIVLEPVNDE